MDCNLCGLVVLEVFLANTNPNNIPLNSKCVIALIGCKVLLILNYKVFWFFFFSKYIICAMYLAMVYI